MAYVSDMIRKEVENLSPDELINVMNDICDGDWSDQEAHHIYDMSEFDSYCDKYNFTPTEIVEGLGTTLHFDIKDKYFMSYDGTPDCIDAIQSFNDYWDLNYEGIRNDTINWIVDEIVDEIEEQVQVNVKGIITSVINEMKKG